MIKLDFQNGKTKLNKETFDTFQNNIQAGINEVTNTTKTNITIGNYSKFGKLIVLNISTTKQENGVANNKAVTLITLATGLRPNANLVVTPVVARDKNYATIPNCYVILRNTGALEFYQASGATKNVKQILGQISYFID